MLAERRRLGVLRADLRADDRFGVDGRPAPDRTRLHCDRRCRTPRVKLVDAALERLRDDRGVVTVVMRSPIIAFLAAK